MMMMLLLNTGMEYVRAQKSPIDAWGLLGNPASHDPLSFLTASSPKVLRSPLLRSPLPAERTISYTTIQLDLSIHAIHSSFSIVFSGNRCKAHGVYLVCNQMSM